MQDRFFFPPGIFPVSSFPFIVMGSRNDAAVPLPVVTEERLYACCFRPGIEERGAVRQVYSPTHGEDSTVPVFVRGDHGYDVSGEDFHGGRDLPAGFQKEPVVKRRSFCFFYDRDQDRIRIVDVIACAHGSNQKIIVISFSSPFAPTHALVIWSLPTPKKLPTSCIFFISIRNSPCKPA